MFSPRGFSNQTSTCVSKLGLIDIYVPTWGVLELVGLAHRVFMGRFTIIPKSFPFLFYYVIYLFSIIVPIIHQKIIKQQYRGFSPDT